MYRVIQVWEVLDYISGCSTTFRDEESALEEAEMSGGEIYEGYAVVDENDNIVPTDYVLTEEEAYELLEELNSEENDIAYCISY